MVKAIDNQMIATDILYLSASTIEVTPNANYAIVKLYSSLYNANVITAIAIFEETRVKPRITFNPAPPLVITPALRSYLEKSLIRILREAWKWGRKVKASNDSSND